MGMGRNRDRRADIIIVGAGVIGTSCAYFLARRGARILLLERSHLAAGASGASAAMINLAPHSEVPEPLRPLNAESYRLIPELEQDFDRSVELLRGGTLFVAMDEEESGYIRKLCEEFQQMGIDSMILEGSEACRFEPLLNPNVQAACLNPVNYHVNPFRLCEGFLKAAQRRGTRVKFGVTVRDVSAGSGKIERIDTDRGSYQADWVVVAAGAHTPQLLSSIAPGIPVEPARGQVIITEACPLVTHRTIFFSKHLYVKQNLSGNFYLGSQTEFVGFENRITMEQLTSIIKALGRGIPLLTRLKALRCFAGFRPMSADELPIIGAVPDCPRLIVATGHGRTGMRYSASTGKAVSELILDGKTELPIEAFGAERFMRS
jgi:glycine/D-amino acid oxidase-like deaminating enzyme